MIKDASLHVLGKRFNLRKLIHLIFLFYYRYICRNHDDFQSLCLLNYFIHEYICIPVILEKVLDSSINRKSEDYHGSRAQHSMLHFFILIFQQLEGTLITYYLHGAALYTT